MTPASHVAQLLERSPEMAGAVAKAAECSLPLLRLAVSDHALLSPIQWALIATCAEVPASWLGSGEPWHGDMLRALERNVRGKRASVELQRVRRNNLRRLTEACTVVNLAALLNTDASMLGDLKNSDQRPFGPKRARSMEEALAMPDGWFDRDDPVPPSLVERTDHVKKARRARAGHARHRDVAPQMQEPIALQLSLGSMASLHQTVVAKYIDLAQSGRLPEDFAYDLLGKLLEAEKRAAAPA